MPETITYVLAGFDASNAFTKDNQAWQKRADTKGDVVVLTPLPGETPKELASRIKGPAHIVMDCHASEDGSFRWSQGWAYKFKDFFQELNQDVKSISVASCYGETAISQMEGVPPGCIVQAKSGAKAVSAGDSGVMVKELTSYSRITPLTILLEALDNSDPMRLAARLKKDNAAFLKQHPKDAKPFDDNANDLLPHTIGIGGHPPVVLDLNVQMAELSAQGKAGSLDAASFGKAIAQVKEHFDEKNDEWWIINKIYDYSNLNIQAKIDGVVKKLESGADVSQFTVDEKRIGYALTIAQMYEDGEMKKRVKAAQKSELPAEAAAIAQTPEIKSPARGPEGKEIIAPEPSGEMADALRKYLDASHAPKGQYETIVTPGKAQQHSKNTRHH